MEEYPVKLHIYDLSKGLARTLSQGLLGKQIDGIWHTGTVVFNREYFFGGDGIMNCPPCGTVLGQPDSIIDLGRTQIPYSMFIDYLRDLASSTYSLGTYHLLDHNCNTFSNEIAQFLTGHSIPQYITDLPHDVMSTPFGTMIRPLLDSMQVNPSNSAGPLFPDASPAGSNAGPHSTPQGAAATASGSAEEPIQYTDSKVIEGFNSMAPSIREKLSGNDFHVLQEVQEYLKSANCTWSLSPPHFNLVARLVQDVELSEKQRGAVSGLLRLALLRPDVVAQMEHSSGQHLNVIMRNYDNLGRQVQLSFVRALCNMSSSKRGHTWLLTNDAWRESEEPMTNSKATVRICVSSVLHDDTEVVKSGTALVYNLTYHKVAEDVAVELGSALIQSLIKTLQPPAPELCLTALCACMEASSEVTGLASVMGLDVAKFAEVSPRCAAACRRIEQKLESFTI